MSPAMYLVAPIDRLSENIIYINEKANTDRSTLYATMAPSRNLLQEQPTSYHARPERENPRPRVALDFDFGHPNARKPQSCAFTQIANWGNAGMAPARGRIPARRSKSSATFGRPTSRREARHRASRRLRHPPQQSRPCLSAAKFASLVRSLSSNALQT